VPPEYSRAGERDIRRRWWGERRRALRNRDGPGWQGQVRVAWRQLHAGRFHPATRRLPDQRVEISSRLSAQSALSLLRGRAAAAEPQLLALPIPGMTIIAPTTRTADHLAQPEPSSSPAAARRRPGRRRQESWRSTSSGSTRPPAVLFPIRYYKAAHQARPSTWAGAPCLIARQRKKRTLHRAVPDSPIRNSAQELVVRSVLRPRRHRDARFSPTVRTRATHDALHCLNQSPPGSC